MRKLVAALVVALTATLGLTACEPQPNIRLWSGHWDEAGLNARLGGNAVTGSHTFSPGGTSWTQLKDNLRDRINGPEPRRITVAPFPDGSFSLAAAARGDYNAHYSEIAAIIAGSTRPLVHIRFAHEANGGWFRWGYAGNSTEQTQFRQMWANFWWFWNTRNVPDKAKLELNLSIGMPLVQPVPWDQFHILGADIYCMWEHRSPVNTQSNLTAYENLVNGNDKDASFSEWSGFVNKFADHDNNDSTPVAQVGCFDHRDADGTKSGVRFINQVAASAQRMATAGSKVELVPYERDPQPEGEFAMTWTEHQESYDDTYCGWANGCGRVHDLDIARRFDEIFGS